MSSQREIDLSLSGNCSAVFNNCVDPAGTPSKLEQELETLNIARSIASGQLDESQAAGHSGDARIEAAINNQNYHTEQKKKERNKREMLLLELQRQLDELYEEADNLRNSIAQLRKDIDQKYDDILEMQDLIDDAKAGVPDRDSMLALLEKRGVKPKDPNIPIEVLINLIEIERNKEQELVTKLEEQLQEDIRYLDDVERKIDKIEDTLNYIGNTATPEGQERLAEVDEKTRAVEKALESAKTPEEKAEVMAKHKDVVHVADLRAVSSDSNEITEKVIDNKVSVMEHNNNTSLSLNF